MPIVKFHRLPHGKDLPLPACRTSGSAGLDLPSAEDIVIAPGERVRVHTGFQIELPPGYEAQIRPRSGMAAMYGVTVLNAPGTIDADFRGEIEVLLINLGHEPFHLHRRDRIAQLVIAPVAMIAVEETEKPLTVSERGDGGFGSTGGLTVVR